MRLLLGLLFLSCAALSRAETFREIVAAFPIGINKDEILKMEPMAKVVPCMVSPKDPSAPRQCVISIKALEKQRMVVQFYFVNDALAAMMLSEVAVPGTGGNKESGTAYLANHRALAGFSALRLDEKLNPIEIQVEKRALGPGNQVALLASTARGEELWIVDENVFDAKRFFLEPTAENREKALKTKEAIDAQRRSSEE